MNTLLDIARSAAVEVGVEIPDTVQGGDADNIKIVHFINQTGSELARRVDWHVLHKTFLVAGTGMDSAFDLANDHGRLERGLSVTCNGAPVRGSLSADEKSSLAPVMGQPRYFWSAGRTISFYPFPPNTQTVAISYQSRNWAKAAGGQAKAVLELDNDEPVLPTSLFVRGAVWRWMRHTGREFNDQMAEYESMIADLASHEAAARQP